VPAKSPEFDQETLPWLDRLAGEVDAYIGALQEPADPALRDLLLHWAQFGFAVLSGAIEHDLIDAYLGDVDELFATRQGRHTFVNVQGYGERPVSACSAEQLAIPHLRIMDFHNASVAGKRMSMHPRIMTFLRHVFRDTPVGM